MKNPHRLRIYSEFLKWIHHLIPEWVHRTKKEKASECFIMILSSGNMRMMARVPTALCWKDVTDEKECANTIIETMKITLYSLIQSRNKKAEVEVFRNGVWSCISVDSDCYKCKMTREKKAK